MTENTWNKDSFIYFILQNNISIALEKLTVLKDKSSSDDFPKVYSVKQQAYINL